LPVRIRCAVECLPFENPKLSAVAVASLSGNDFAFALDKAIARSGVKLIEAKAGPQPEQLSPCAGVAAPCTHSSLSYCRTREFRGS
jgi:hypothetical protein